MADAPVVERCAAQRQPKAGEPVCVICGRYGEYVCDATDEDVCCLECRDTCVSRQSQSQTPQSSQLQRDEETLRRAQQLRSKLGIEVSAGSAAETGDHAHNWPIPLVDFAQEQHCVQLPAELLANLVTNGFKRPTPVQMQIIPCALLGHHILVSAPTGTGKTASYLIPAIAQVLLAREEENEKTVALVLAPIRELAIQIESVAKLLMKSIANMKTALLVGGFPVPAQRYRLQNGVQVIVATPGRFLDIFTSYGGGEAILASIRTCVVDEVDMMLDVGFRPQISQIVALLVTLAKKTSHGVQLLFFSATVSDEVEALVRQILKAQSEQSYIRVNVGGSESKTAGRAQFSLNPRVHQQVRWVEDKAKKDELFTFLKGKSEESTLVFVGSKIGASMLAEAIEKRCRIGAAATHGDKSQQERLTLLEAFINLEIPVLVSTNVLSRGMDLLHVQNVVVYDFPKKFTDYVHLIGRTGRGDEVPGNALTLVNSEDRAHFRELVPLLRGVKVSVPHEVYQSIHSDNAKQRSQSRELVVDESKRAFRVRKQLNDEIGAPISDWKEWNNQASKRRRVGPYL